jgi:hypothetical protein
MATPKNTMPPMINSRITPKADIWGDSIAGGLEDY